MRCGALCTVVRVLPRNGQSHRSNFWRGMETCCPKHVLWHNSTQASAIVEPQPGRSMLGKLESKEQVKVSKNQYRFIVWFSTGDIGAPSVSQDPSLSVLIFSRWLVELGLSSWLLQGNVSSQSPRYSLLGHRVPDPAAWNWLETFLAFEINNLKIMLSLLVMISFCLQK